MNTPKVRTFNRKDWTLLGGAKPFTEAPPLVVDGFEYADVIMVADMNGLQLITPEGELRLYIKAPLWSQEIAKLVLSRGLELRGWAKMTTEEIVYDCKEMGFSPVL